MKSLTYNSKNILIAGFLILLASSCDLTLQREWEYVREPFGNQPLGITAYEWLTQVNSDPSFNNPDGMPEFEFMLEAIERTGLRELYDDPNAPKTFLLLRNSAFNGNNQLIQNMAGNRNFPLDSISTERLEHALSYHIIEEALGQDDIPKFDFFLYYQTLVPGDTGVVELNKRLFDYSIRINTTIARVGAPAIPSNMPPTARGQSVALHNYIFTNGIGHQLNGYVRYQPY